MSSRQSSTGATRPRTAASRSNLGEAPGGEGKHVERSGIAAGNSASARDGALFEATRRACSVTSASRSAASKTSCVGEKCGAAQYCSAAGSSAAPPPSSRSCVDARAEVRGRTDVGSASRAPPAASSATQSTKEDPSRPSETDCECCSARLSLGRRRRRRRMVATSQSRRGLEHRPQSTAAEAAASPSVRRVRLAASATPPSDLWRSLTSGWGQQHRAPRIHAATSTGPMVSGTYAAGVVVRPAPALAGLTAEASTRVGDAGGAGAAAMSTSASELSPIASSNSGSLGSSSAAALESRGRLDGAAVAAAAAAALVFAARRAAACNSLAVFMPSLCRTSTRRASSSSEVSSGA